MGQAKRRGTFEDRKAQANGRNEERRRIDREAWLQRQADRDAILDRDYTPPCAAAPRQRSIGTGGFGIGGRKGSSMLVAAVLAAMSGLGPIMVDDRKY